MDLSNVGDEFESFMHKHLDIYTHCVQDERILRGSVVLSGK